MVLCKVFLVFVQNFFQVAVFGFEQFGSAGDFAEADLVGGGNLALGFAFIQVFEQLPAQGQGLDFAGGENLRKSTSMS